MWKNNSYPNIDLEETGIHLKNLIAQKGYTVKDIQRILHLSCPQPVYRWFKGQILPSVDHLYVLSKLLCVHMEELLLPAQENIVLFELWGGALNKIALRTCGQTFINKLSREAWQRLIIRHYSAALSERL